MTHDPNMDDPPFDADPDLDAATDTRLGAMGAFASVIRQTHWFTRIGQPLSLEENDLIARSAAATGFEAWPADIRDWDEAAEAAQNLNVNSPAWEAEESLRAAATLDALDFMTEEELQISMTHIQAVAAEVVPARIWDVATMWGMTDEQIIDAAVGHTMHACHNAALLVATGGLAGGLEDEIEDHAFSLTFKLFEMGRWPIGITGQSYMVF